MIKEFDALAITSDNVSKLTDREKKERVKKREELLSKMSKSELSELLNRPYPPQMKAKIKRYI